MYECAERKINKTVEKREAIDWLLIHCALHARVQKPSSSDVNIMVRLYNSPKTCETRRRVRNRCRKI